MTETRKESLSALIDGEASEIEVHRLLREFKSDDSLSDSWAIYQHVRTTVRRGQQPRSTLTPDHHLSLFDRISQSVHAEEGHDAASVANTSASSLSRTGPSSSAPSSTKVVMGSLALAASLVVAVFIGVQKPEESSEIVAAGQSAPIEVQTVSTAESIPQTSELVELDDEKQRRLRAYLNQHDRMARMNAKQQLVNYKENTGK